MSKIVTRKKVSDLFGGVLAPARIDKNATVKDVVDDIMSQNEGMEVNWLDDGSAELMKDDELVGTVTEEN